MRLDPPSATRASGWSACSRRDVPRACRRVAAFYFRAAAAAETGAFPGVDRDAAFEFYCRRIAADHGAHRGCVRLVNACDAEPCRVNLGAGRCDEAVVTAGPMDF